MCSYFETGSIDNYKCFSNFECRFDHINLILGSNGSGKSTVFEVLRGIQALVTGISPIRLFKESTLTRWQKRDVQTFELEIEGNGGTYEYRLEIEHEVGQYKQRIQLESVRFNDGSRSGLLYEAKLGDIQLFRDDYTTGTMISTDWTQSGLPFLAPKEVNTKVTWLKNWFKQNLACMQIDPLHMKVMAESGEQALDEYALNFVGWYRYRVATDMNATIRVYNALRQLYEDFHS